MAWFKKLALFLIAISPCITASFNDTRQRPVLDPNTLESEGKYIVTLHKNVTPSQFRSHITKINATYRRNSQGDEQRRSGVDKTFAIGDYRAYSGVFDKDTIAALWNDTMVVEIERNAYFTVQRNIVTQKHAPWGLATLSSKKRGATSYRYKKSAGNGTFAYVIDSGINTKHVDFGGRASAGYSVVANDMTDILGHGTHVAGIIGGETYGVAKQTELISVKVFLSNGGQTSDVIDGLQWAVRDIIAKGRQNRAVINMSLGGPFSFALNRAVDAAFQQGILVVVAAGNDAGPARYTSPASAESALTVGAIDINWQECSFSNYGPEVNIQAPGLDILSAFIATDNATATLSGTSMAAPHVAGLALYMAALEKINTAEELKDRILELGTTGKVQDLEAETPNLIAHNDSH